MLSATFVNMLLVGVHNDAALLDISDCTGYVAKGSNKDDKHIAKKFIPHMERIDRGKQMIWSTLHFALHCVMQHYVALHYVMFNCVEFRSIALHCVSSYHIVMCYIML